MSASGSSESSDPKVENIHESCSIRSRYALYLFSYKKHASLSDSNNHGTCLLKNETKLSDSDEPAFCLSLLEGNLGAELETVIRCYLLKSLSAHENTTFENEGKYTVLQGSDDSDDVFGCYYHRLSTSVDLSYEENNSQDNKSSSKMHTFFICLIGPANGIMESFCPELGTFCCSLVPLLDPEGLKNQEHMQLKLKSWYYYCVEYVGRCIKKFKEDVAQVLHCSLWGNVKIICSDEETVWDLERLIETCSLMPECTVNEKDIFSVPENVLSLEVINNKFVLDKNLGTSQYCMRWYEKLKNCHSDDHAALHSILEGFRLKATQDLNTLKRLVQKAETDHYALFRAYHFLQGSGYENVLLFHVKHEGNVAKEMGTIEVITCLQEFMATNSYSFLQKYHMMLSAANAEIASLNS